MTLRNSTPFPAEQLAGWVCDARRQTLALVADLTDEQLLGPRLPVVNPLLWEMGHIAWFQEKWVLRHCAGQKPILAEGSALYDSAAVPHEVRWDLPLPDREQTLRYLHRVTDQTCEWLQHREPSADEMYFVLLSVFHEDMHAEAFTYTRQTLSYPAPKLAGTHIAESSPYAATGQVGPACRAGLGQAVQAEPTASGPLRGDAEMPGGTFWLGAARDEPFVFDNEKWAHPVEIRPFAMARAPVTQGEFAEFVESGGYRRQELWSAAGWQWREANEAQHPLYWQRNGSGRWLRRDFDRWTPLEPHRPVVHVNWFEAEAYCRWSGRRLPTEAEWETCAAAEPNVARSPTAASKRRFSWGAEPPQPRHGNLDWRGGGCLDVAALPEGDSASGCRQMIGNVWEWTASDFLPYPGFVADPYQEYSAPWFGTHKVLRGGCWATRGRLLRNTWRNFYLPDRRDVWAGFRTCATA